MADPPPPVKKPSRIPKRAAWARAGKDPDIAAGSRVPIWERSCLPTLESKHRKHDAVLKKNEADLRAPPWRGETPVEVPIKLTPTQVRRVERVMKARLYLLSQHGPNSFVIGSDVPEERFMVMLGSQSCSCMQPACVHLLFVMLRVLKVAWTDVRLFAPSLHGFEVDALVRDFREGRWKTARRPPRARATADCPICLLEMVEGESLVSCTAGCRNYLHKHCMDVWFAALRQQGDAQHCPLCRATWQAVSPTPCPAGALDLPLDVPALPFAGPVSVDALPRVRPWIAAFGEPLVSCIIARDWQIREAAVKRMVHQLGAGEGDAAAHAAACDVLESLCADPVLRVYTAALSLLPLVLRGGVGGVEPALGRILTKCGDANKRTSELSLAAVKAQLDTLLPPDTLLLCIGDTRTCDPGEDPGGVRTWRWWLGRLVVLAHLLAAIPAAFVPDGMTPPRARRGLPADMAAISAAVGAGVAAMGEEGSEARRRMRAPLAQLGSLRAFVAPVLLHHHVRVRDRAASVIAAIDAMRVGRGAEAVDLASEHDGEVASDSTTATPAPDATPTSASATPLPSASLPAMPVPPPPAAPSSRSLDMTVCCGAVVCCDGDAALEAADEDAAVRAALCRSESEGAACSSDASAEDDAELAALHCAMQGDCAAPAPAPMTESLAAARAISPCTCEVHVQLCDLDSRRSDEGFVIGPEYAEGAQWRKGALLGVGAFSSCFIAQDLTSGRLLAVKQVAFCRNTHRDEQGVLRLLAREIAILRTLPSHPGVVTYHGAAAADNHINIFMEYMAGGSVAALLQRFGALPLPVVKRYTAQVVEGLAFLHSHGVVHRDLKGANLVVDHTGERVKLCDFGAAARLAGLATLPGECKSMRGTPAFMAPEVIRGESHGRRADTWSLGCVVIEMAAGRAPWAEDTGMHPYALMFKIASTTALPVLPASLDEEGRAFVALCMERDVAARMYPSQLRGHAFLAAPAPASPVAAAPQQQPQQQQRETTPERSAEEACVPVALPVMRQLMV